MNLDFHTDVRLVPMSQAEFLSKEKRLVIHYSIISVHLGKFLIASTAKGICLLIPINNRHAPLKVLASYFPKAVFRNKPTEQHRKAALLLNQQFNKVRHIKLHVYGTPFQIAVWQELLNIPTGKVSTYLNIAKCIGRPRSARPIGQAVSKNPITYIIPCHRVICSNGNLGGYRWGIEKKIKFLNKEINSAVKSRDLSNWEPTFF